MLVRLFSTVITFFSFLLQNQDIPKNGQKEEMVRVCAFGWRGKGVCVWGGGGGGGPEDVMIE